MTQPYSDALVTRHNRADSRFTMEYCFTITLIPYGLIIVPAGFVSDGASTGAASFLYPSSGRRYFMPAIVHDYLYSAQGVILIEGTPIKPDRKTADAILRQLMRRNECRWYTCWIFWAMVRLFGRSHWMPK